MLGRCTCLVVLWGLVCGVSVAGAETLTVQWLPGESYAGGKQYDARLDRPVKLWGAGMPVKKAFSEITAQTGVQLACLPLGDDNERICINAYLNAKTPPDLRAVMAQLSWVLDCAFGYTGEGEARVYYLLSTSVAAGAMERVTQARRARYSRFFQEREEEKRRRLEALPKRWEEIRAALSLSRDEAIAKYRGVDDSLLAAVIEPGRRAFGEYLAGLPAEEMAGMLQSGTRFRDWASLSPEQQSELRAVFTANLEMLRLLVPDDVARIASYDWGADRPRRVSTICMDGLLGLIVYEGTDDTASPDPSRIAGGALITLAPWNSDIAVADQLLVRSALGEPTTDEVRSALREAERERRRQQEARQEAQQMKELLRERVQLSEGTRQALSEVVLPIEDDQSYALWQIQEAAAAVTGRHVVSDCFWQPERSVKQAAGTLCQEGAGEVNALKVLCLLSAARGFEDPVMWAPGGIDATPGWEFGDAGQFLRFRSAERDLYRASLPPAEVLREVDALIAPQMRRDCGPDCRGGNLEVALPLPQATRLAAQVSEQQGSLGGRLTFGDPLDRNEACRQAARREVLGLLASGRGYGLAALAELTDDQMERLQGEGLKWRDFPLLQKGHIQAQLQPLTPEQAEELTVRLVSGPHGYAIELYREEERVFEQRLLPRGFRLRVHHLKSLVAATGETGAVEEGAGLSRK